MSEQFVIEHCSPTLAGIKTANMFTLRINKKTDVNKEVRDLNISLKEKGLRVIPLKKSENYVLIYMYRPDYLRRDLRHPKAMQILKKKGYDCSKAESCIKQLVDHLATDKVFPHEVGLFLGYPPEDVRSFMEDSRRGVKCTGCWKAYGNEEEAEKTFSKFRKCTALYRRELSRGKSLAQLAVRTRICGGRDYYNEKKGKNSYE